MKIKTALTLIIISLIFLSACSAQGPRGRKGTSGPQRVEFRTGTEALVLSFPEQGFNRLYEGDTDIHLILEIQNKGAYPLPEEREGLRGRIWIGGYDPNILELIPEEGYAIDDRALEGKSPINLEGGRSAIVFTGGVFSLPEGATTYKAPIIVTATYLYKTASSPLVCIDPNPRSGNVKEKVCDIGKYGSIVSGGGQGAPVVVSRVEEEVTSGSILFKIEIQNVGKGLVINENDINRDPNIGYDWRDMNKVTIEDIIVGSLTPDDCKPSIGDEVRLINNRGIIICRLNTAGINGVYTTPMNIKLRYGYSSSIRKEIEILKDITLI